jgi:nucleotide-binding universal stress UspA family protein/hemerythrin-like domain-containing protein
MYKHLLVPIDGTPLAARTVEQAVAYARAGGARLTFLHARADLGARGEGALLHAMAPEAFAEAAAGNARAIVAKAEAAARAAGLPSGSRVITSDRPHDAILEAAREAGCDLVFMASHGRRGLKEALLGSVTRKVLERATLPVLVVAVESNLEPIGDEQRALGILRDEHRSLAAVLHALLAQVEQPAPDPALLRAMLFYIEQFPERLHHPKEDAYLFDRLRRRTSTCDALIAALHAQHVAGAEQFAALRRLLDGADGQVFAQAVREFAQAQWQHMRDEEQIVLPAASLHLQADDWREIAAAFAANGDPRFEATESFEALAARLLALAAPDKAG